MILQGDEAQVKAQSIWRNANLDVSTVCVERTMGPEIILDPPDELLGDVGLMESHFFSFGDSVSVGAR
jgi:hypothetical protein